ncbi:MAG: hydrolase [Oscillospiraceae bacterium]|jgi:hypothetical protein|nr:hydrolase [Oscillospiraceae bacterium]
MSLSVAISRGGAIYQPSVLDGAVWETEIGGAPGRFAFSLWDDAALKIGEGDAVAVTMDGRNVFYGYIFSRRASHTGAVSVTAYDQLRYLKNRDTYVYGDVTASALVRRVAASHSLKTGAIAETGVRLEACVEDNKSLADILRNALAKTEAAGGGRYVLYDDFGALSLAGTEDMRRGLLVGADAGQTFLRSVSIDRDSYNTVKLVCERKSGRSIFTAEDPQNAARWGKLQYFEKIPDNVNGQAMAAALLRQYNRERRELYIGGVPGDPAVRAGCSLYLSAWLAGGADAACSVERARHRWEGGGYTMDLELTYA